MSPGAVDVEPANPPAVGFGARLVAVTARRGPLCAGIDPHPGLLRDWGLPDDPSGLERFALSAAELIAPEVAVVKPQSAFFERHGARGIAVLERVLRTVAEAGALSVLDVKRGDIGSTMAGYAEAYLADGAPLAADAVTVSPYLGVGSLEPAFALAERTGRGVFVLALTSNPEGAQVQGALGPAGAGAPGGEPVSVAQAVVDTVAARNTGCHPLGPVGVVVGATTAPGALRLDRLNGPVLAPGVGAQGATLADLRRVFGPAVRAVLPATSRDLLRHGPEPAALRAAVRSAADAALACLIPPSGQVDGGTPR